MKAVVLAGGKGTRLHPYTISLPKPLLPVGDKPVLGIILEQLKKHDIDEVVLAVGHLANEIKAFFGEGKDFGIKIKYSIENEPLGTVGPLRKLKEELNETFLVMNGDIISSIDYTSLINHHKTNDAPATIALTKRHVNIDFGLAELDGENYIKKYTEKPRLDFLVSMGIYVFEPEIINYIPEEKFDLPELVSKLISNNVKISGYVYEGYWLDIGRPEDYEKANEDVNNDVF